MEFHLIFTIKWNIWYQGRTKYIVVCFDESLNEVIRKKKMDICVQLWDLNRNKVAARYFSSAFLGHTTAKDLYDGFTTVLNNEILPKILQISMDGPTVNWKFFDALNNDFGEKLETTLLEIGSCRLHVVHGAFQNGHKNAVWNVNSVLRSFYKLFHDSPARRADYLSIKTCDKFPKKFCSTRWVENVDVCQRALDVYENVKTYVERSKLPDNFTDNTVKDAINEILVPAKISTLLRLLKFP